MGDLRFRSVCSVAAVLACGSLSACYLGPDPVQFGALAVVGGKATAVVALCGRTTRDLRINQADEGVPHDLSWSVTVTAAQPAHDVDVELLGAAPDGRRDYATPAATITVLDRTLTSFEAGHRYRLDASRFGPEGTTAPRITFTTDDFARIGDGQVLAPRDRDKSHVVSRDSFVKDACGRRGPGA